MIKKKIYSKINTYIKFLQIINNRKIVKEENYCFKLNLHMMKIEKLFCIFI